MFFFLAFTRNEKTFCVLEYVRTQSNKSVQRAFSRKFNKTAPTGTALDTVPQDMLQRVWQELDHRLDACRVTGGAHEMGYKIYIPLNFLFEF